MLGHHVSRSARRQVSPKTDSLTTSLPPISFTRLHGGGLRLQLGAHRSEHAATHVKTAESGSSQKLNRAFSR
jgi:hypothetical protein